MCYLELPLLLIYISLSRAFQLAHGHLILSALNWTLGSRLGSDLCRALFLDQLLAKDILITEGGRSTRGQAKHPCTFEAYAWSCLLSLYWPK